jgi:hypothetical protein
MAGRLWPAARQLPISEVATRSVARSVGATLLTTGIIGLITLLVHGMRLAAAPDIYGDEGLYALVAVNLANGRGLLDDSGTFFWHPPLYPVLEAIYLRLTGLANADAVAVVLATRWINVAFSVATACLLFLFGRRLAGTRGGLLIVALFIGDLFVQRINRRSMLETSAMFLMLTALAIYSARPDQLPSRRRAIATGLVLGLAVLTKEIALIALGAIVLQALIFERRLLRSVGVIGLVTAAVYAVYPVWAFAIGQGQRFLEFKLSAFTRISRFLGFAAPAPALPPGTVLPANPSILQRLGDAVQAYGPTYALLVLGALFTMVLLLRYRHRVDAQLLATWSGLSYLVIALGQPAAFGDQFFYYVLIPAIVVIGYILATWVAPTRRQNEQDVARPGRSTQSADAVAATPPVRLAGADGPPPVPVAASSARRGGPKRIALVLVAGALAALFIYDAGAWATRYVVGRDDSYAVVTAYIRAHIPTGTTIVAGADVSNFLLRPDYDIQFYRDRRSVETTSVRYFLLSSKEAALGYNQVTRDWYAWVLQHSRPLIERQGETFWTLGLYEWVGARQ